VLGPKPREVKPPKTDLKTAVKAKVKAGKRKLKELVGDDADASGSKSKKRKIQPATGVKRSLSSKVVKTAATALKKVTVKKTTVVSKTKSPASKGKSPMRRRASASAVLKKATTATRIIKTYGKTATSPRERGASGASIAALADGTSIDTKGFKAYSAKKATPVKKTMAKKSPASSAKAQAKKRSVSLGDIIAKVASPRKAIELSRAGEIRVVQDE
jgi:histone-lysine N-methyltransferase ASH1L